MGVQLSWLKRTTYNCDTDGSNPSAPTKIMEKTYGRMQRFKNTKTK